FSPMDRKWKIFQRRESITALTALPEFPAHPQIPEAVRQRVSEKPTGTGATISFQDAIQRNIVESVTPPVVIINRKGDLLYSTRKTGKFFEPSVGNASLNIFDMAREGLKVELAIAVRQAIKRGLEVTANNLSVRTNGDTTDVNVTVRPITMNETLRDLLMIVIEEVPSPKKRSRRTGKPEIDTSKDATISELEKNLQYTKENLQTTIEEMETSQEELKSMNEELQSTNEELQSTNEELTTSKEELQSLNEELMTVNAELQAKNDELALANNDMRNLLNSTQIPTLFLDNNLRIKRYTNAATTLFTLIPGDIGRPITDITSHLRHGGLLDDVRTVLETLVFKEMQVESDDKRWYMLRIMPYRTLENLIDGAVITFFDITDLKRLEQVLEERKHLCILAELVQESDDAVVVQDTMGSIQAWTNAAEKLYGWSEAEVIGRDARSFIAPKDLAAYDKIIFRIRTGEAISSFETQRITKDNRVVKVSCRVRRLNDESGKVISIATTERPVARAVPARRVRAKA
ncbi:MAG TPA: PAS domain-containing protein, partial [Methanoregula sp.]|nr:PAS domain-containing protein [Methanoregula sp.]